MPRSNVADKLAIREIIENWAVYRDGLMWDRFRSVWHEDGQMWSTWFQGSAEDFIKVSIKGYENGVRVIHGLHGMAIDIKGKRAIAQTKMTIAQRGPIDGKQCEVTCAGRFYDFLEKRKGKWGIVLRRCIYEKDKIEAIDPSMRLKLDKSILARFPIGYRHLAYLQTKGGFNVKLGLPGLDGPEVEALYAKGAEWLKGKKL